MIRIIEVVHTYCEKTTTDRSGLFQHLSDSTSLRDQEGDWQRKRCKILPAMLYQVKTRPEAKKAGIAVGKKGGLLVQVKSRPVGRQANREVVGLLAQYFQLPESRIRIVRGFHQRSKIVEVNDK